MLNNIDLAKSNHENLPNKCLLKNGTIIDPVQREEFKKDLLIENGKIVKIAENINEENCEVIDCKGKYISTGFFDLHVHFREPGLEQAENIITGSNAAMAGGFTGVLMMANTNPCVDNKFIFRDLNSRKENLLVDAYQVPAVTIGRKGEVLVEMAELVSEGALAFSDDGSGIQKSETMRGALEYSKMFDKPLLVHEEDTSFNIGVMNESLISTELGLPATPTLSEDNMVARDILLTDYTKGRTHFQHISTKQSIEMVRQAKKKGINVTCEVTPHHLYFTDEKIRSFSTNYKMNPPLRSNEDLEAILEGFKDGTIDAIATDHAPHTPESKKKEFNFAPFGVIGLETAFNSSYTKLVLGGYLDLMTLLEKLIVNPRKIINLDYDLLKEGQVANLVVFDTETKTTITEDFFKSKARNSAFIGEELTGKIHAVINKNRICKSC